MFSAIGEFFNYGIPWWIWSMPAVAGGIGIFVTVSRFLGWRNAINATIAFAAVTIVALAHARGRQRGWKAHIKKENRDAESLVKRVNAARDRATRRGRTKRMYEDDGFKRK